MISYTYKESVINIDDRAYVDIRLNSEDTVSIALFDNSFKTQNTTNQTLPGKVNIC